MLVLGRDRLLGPPKSCDVVVDFLFRRDLEQNDGSLTPIADRLDPQAWATFEPRFEIMVSNEVLLSLHQSEAARIEVGEGADLQIARIVERTPELLTLAVVDGEAARIVDGRAEIIEVLAIIWPEEEHACHRSKAAVLKVHPWIKRHLDLKDGGLAGADREAVTRSRALAVQQGMNDDGRCVRRRLLQPKCLEQRKFLALRLAGIDGKPAGGQSVGFSLGDRPEVTCAAEDADLVVVIWAADRRVNTETGKTNIHIGPLRYALTEREVIAPISDRDGASVRHLVQVDPVLVEKSPLQELSFECHFLAAPHPILGQETNGSVLVVVQILQRIRQLFVRRPERLACNTAGEVAYVGRTKLHICCRLGSCYTRQDGRRRDSHRGAKKLTTIQGGSLRF